MANISTEPQDSATFPQYIRKFLRSIHILFLLCNNKSLSSNQCPIVCFHYSYHLQSNYSLNFLSVFNMFRSTKWKQRLCIARTLLYTVRIANRCVQHSSRSDTIRLYSHQSWNEKTCKKKHNTSSTMSWVAIWSFFLYSMVRMAFLLLLFS